jgi:rubrerythrin
VSVLADHAVAVFQWDYDSHDEQITRLYAQGKARQWNAATDLDWDHELDPDNPLGVPDSFLPLGGTPLWDRLPSADRVDVRRHIQAWEASQALHGEQFALNGLGRVISATEDLDTKLFAATQIVDEARHLEAFTLLTDKIGVRYPPLTELGSLYEGALGEADMDFFAIAALLLEYVALTSLTAQRAHLGDPLGRALMENIARDEARHLAFGRALLRRRLDGITDAELRRREEFVLECCRTLKTDYTPDAVWRTLGYGEDVVEQSRRSAPEVTRRCRTFRQVVPAFQDVGLFGPRVRAGLTSMGLIRFARKRPAADVDTADDARAHSRRDDIEAVIRLATSHERTAADGRIETAPAGAARP